MIDVACGLLGDRRRARSGTATGRARDLTVAWLRWHYFDEIVEEASLAILLRRARATGRRYCLVQSYGHIVAEHAGPAGSTAESFFDALGVWASTGDFIFAGQSGRCMLVDLAMWAAAGEPTDGELVPFSPELARHLIDLGGDLAGIAPFQAFLDEMCEKAGRGVFVLNYEPYDDIAERPAGFPATIARLYCVAAGFKPNRLLETHGMDSDSRIMFFDYSTEALAFRRRLDADWDGRDYPAYLRALFERSGDAHYYLWPGVTPDAMDWIEFERLWAMELARWGGADAFVAHWRRFQAIERDYLVCNILEPETLLSRIEDRPGSAVWWSNAFSTIYSATRYSLDEKSRIYGHWIAGLADRAPGIFLYGSDHSNSSVNGITARDYREGYDRDGGDPLGARAFHRHAIRF